MAGIYLHIPFCKQACHYCDFHFSTNHTVKGELVSAMVKELELQQDYLSGEVIETIYFGGGTPSLLNRDEIDVLFKTIRQLHSVKTDAEITLEANPDDLTPDTLALFKQAGINRLSIGVQSFHTPFLIFLNRAHNAETALRCIEYARDAGFTNISIDLIYAIPGETDSLWLADIQQALLLSPEHISCYSLTIEEKTAFGKWAASGKLKPEPDAVAARHLELLMPALNNAGYEQYEVSNFAKPGYYAKHNSSYWRGKKYLGIGPAAHSYNGDSRHYAVANNHQYIRAIAQGVLPVEHETLTREDKINEYILTTLRTSWGTDLSFLNTLYQYNVLTIHADYIQLLVNKNLATLDNHVLRLTNSGKLLADKISSDLFVA